jgi:hypothetical protein
MLTKYITKDDDDEIIVWIQGLVIGFKIGYVLIDDGTGTVMVSCDTNSVYSVGEYVQIYGSFYRKNDTNTKEEFDFILPLGMNKLNYNANFETLWFLEVINCGR